jgi:hypothetical protein
MSICLVCVHPPAKYKMMHLPAHLGCKGSHSTMGLTGASWGRSQAVTVAVTLCCPAGVKVDIPVLTDKDIDDLQNFGCKNHMVSQQPASAQSSWIGPACHAIFNLHAKHAPDRCMVYAGLHCGELCAGKCQWLMVHVDLSITVHGQQADVMPTYHPHASWWCLQTGDDVRMIRRVLNQAGGQSVSGRLPAQRQMLQAQAVCAAAAMMP